MKYMYIYLKAKRYHSMQASQHSLQWQIHVPSSGIQGIQKFLKMASRAGKESNDKALESVRMTH